MKKLLTTSLLCLTALSVQAGKNGFRNTPILPGTQWHVHDPDRPKPKPVEGSCQSTPAPKDATVLFDGKNLHALTNQKWQLKEGVMIVGRGNQKTKESFGDCQVHLEFMFPKAICKGAQRGNSGLFFMDRYEIQILNGWQSSTYADGTIGAIYGQTPPLVNACSKPGEWNSYDIIFTAPRFDKQGKLISPARFTALLNGVLVQNNTVCMGTTRWKVLSSYKAHPARQPIMLQNHGDPVEFRNFWLRDLDKK